MRSGELARHAGLSTDTLRYYERKGVLPKPVRTGSGYRNYDDGALARVQLIQRALAVGFSIEELAEVLAIRSRGGIPCQRVRELARQKVITLQEQITDLQQLVRDMRTLLRDWDKRIARGKGRCANLLESIPRGIARQGASPLLQAKLLCGKSKKGMS